MSDSMSWAAEQDELEQRRKTAEHRKYNGFITQADIDRYLEDNRELWDSTYYWRYSPGKLYLLNETGPDRRHVELWKRNESLSNRTVQHLESFHAPALSYVMYLGPHIEFKVSPLTQIQAKVLYKDVAYITYLHYIREIPEWIADLMKKS